MRPTDLDLEVLRSFVTAAELGGFTAAGARLGRTQAAISIQIKKLEEKLGRQVFERKGRALALTRDGESLLGYARRLLALNNETVQFFQEPFSQGELRLGVEEYFVPQHLSRILSRFAKAYPRIRIEAKIALKSQLFAALDRGELDLAIARRDERRPGGRLIRRERLCWAAAAPFTSGREIPLALCVAPLPCFLRAKACAALEAVARPWRVIYTSESIMGIIAAASAGLGIAVLPESALTEGLTALGPEHLLPDLGEIELALFGENQGRTQLTATFRGFVDESLRTLVHP